MSSIQLRVGVSDSIRWTWEPSGIFSARSAYASGFAGKEHDLGARAIWDSRAPLRCKMFLWLAFKNRLWTSDRLKRRGLPHQAACPFCDQEDESVDHLLLSCSFTRTVWFQVMRAWGKEEWAPRADDRVVLWAADLPLDPSIRKDAYTLVGLVLWETCKHRNAVVFDGETPSTRVLLSEIA